MIQTLVQRIAELAAVQPEKPAVCFKKDMLTYAQLFEQIKAAGSLLRKMGLQRGDRVLYTALSKPEAVVTLLGIQYAGCIVVAMDKNATPENGWSIYEDTTASLYLTDRSMKGYEDQCRVYSLKEFYAQCTALAEAPEDMAEYTEPEPEDIAEMIFTTGTTGRPKGVMLSYRAVYHISINTRDGIGILPEDRVLIPLPLNHSLALREMRAAFWQGCTVVLQNGFTFARDMEKNIRELGCTGMVIVPASFELTRSQMQGKFSEIVGQLRYIEVGAGSLSVRQRKDFTKLLPNTKLNNTWGSSETGGALFTNVNLVSEDPVKVAAIGKPLGCLEIKALGPDGQALEHTDMEHPGRLALKGDMVMSGYWNRPEATADALRDGWLVTNDLVYMDEEQYVYMLGRADDIINVGGEKVSPIEVENIASEYPAMKECACIGVPDPKEVLGQIPVLFVVKDAGYSEDDLKVFLASHMERFKIPQEFVSVPELPRNRMKKLDRKEMRRLWDQRGQEQELTNPVIEALLTRRSIRNFTDQKIERDMLEMILKAGYYAPTGHNLQTWQFTVVEDEGRIRRLKEAAQESAKAEKVYCYGFNNPSCLILVSNDNRNYNGCQDASCAAENMLLAAHSYGLGACWLNVLRTLRNTEPVKEVLDEFGVPENHTVWSMIALGYPAEEGKLLARKEEVVHFAR